MDGRTPLIVGGGIENRLDNNSTDELPINMMVAATEAALADTADLRDRIDWVRVPWGVWPYHDPGRLVADRIKAPSARTTLSTVGGNQVYELVIDSARRIAEGSADVVVICGAESQRARAADRRAGRHSQYFAERPDAAADETFGDDHPLSTEAEIAAGVGQPVVFYAMAESAIRHRNDETVEVHRDRIAELWATGARVAAGNPHAWLRTGATASEIATATDANRPITAPYTKLMTSNNMVNQAGAIVMCSAETAGRAGIDRDRWVFPWAGAGAHDPWFVTNRWALDESPAMRVAGRRTLGLAQLDVDDCQYLDLYSCFPAAVQVGQRELGVPVDREWTISGGLTFAAGPLNCYCLLPLVQAVDLLRGAPTERAFLTGNGGYFTKHSFVVLGGEPSPTGFVTDDVQAEVDQFPTRPTPVPAASGTEMTIEAHTVVYDRDAQPQTALVSLLDANGSRHFTSSDNLDLVNAAATTDLVGTRFTPA